MLKHFIILLKIKFTLSFHHNPFSQIVVGSINGVIIGMTSIYTMPLVFLLQSLNYNKNTTIQFLGIAFFLYPLGQIISFSNFDLITKEIVINSLIILVPIFCGLFIGQKIRYQISENLFQKFFYIMLLFMSTVILINFF